MAKKITTKIKINNYDLSYNVYTISFQLAPGVENDIVLTAEYDADGFGLTLDTENYLSILGFAEGEKVNIFDELKAWAWRSRAKLGGQSYADIMYTRIRTVDAASQLQETVEKEHRGKAQAERIAMEAPTMDWAMSCLEELEAAEKVLEQAFKQFQEFVGVDWSKPPITRAKSTTADINTLLDRFETSVRRERDYKPPIFQWSDLYLEGAEALQSDSYSARRAILDHVEALTPKSPAPSSEAIDDAVDAIHSDLLRFLTKMSFREHDYVRGFIREEIEKVVGGVR